MTCKTFFMLKFQHFQVIWVCMLCRKKQELLSKTGQWINKAAEADGFMRPGGVS